MRTLLVANRAEIARRIIRTAREMGLRTVAVYTSADQGAPHAKEADVSVPLHNGYLDGDEIVAAARRAGADAVHPGYGFLSENAAFAETCIAAGLTWIGPRPDTIRSMADKVRAKQLMASAGVPVLPGGDASGAATVGFPVLVKAAAGGGGRGMRLVETPAELGDALEAAAREAASSFGDGTVFVERWIASPRHVEVQIVGDEHGTVVSLGDRDCSVQRRHQKVIEEAPAPGLPDLVRAAMAEAAVTGAKSLGYVGAGTFEFLVDGGEFFFLEMNTRLQVEHPVTEAVMGIDLVRLQLDIAAGLPLHLEEMASSGHAVEARLYAEDPAAGFLPSPGTVHRFRSGPTPNIRYDSGVEDGTEVPVFYDPMLAKVIAHGPTREEATRRLARALRELQVHGVRTNRDLLVGVLEHPDWIDANINTQFLDRHEGLERTRIDVDRHVAAAVVSGAAGRRRDAAVLSFAPPGWRNMPGSWQHASLEGEAGRVDVSYRIGGGPTVDVRVDGRELSGRVFELSETIVDWEIDGLRHRLD
ncbi:MAG TPA: biotin carboxylase N-terminal domain-containing protein, partial [Acidimicrobiales bacterium]|nr:biotin carboxylase N-terminal domain-containing protein [Acidimicrobiales bacterium]